jgi:serine/threonine protein kinase
MKSRSTGDTYYLNTVTGETQFERPTLPAHTAEDPQGLPAGWEEKTSGSTGDTYYRNTLTRETTWVRPTLPAKPPGDEGAVEVPRPQLGSLGIPAGWEKKTSGSTGDKYYLNTFTGETTWERPTEPAQLPAAVAEVRTQSDDGGVAQPIGLGKSEEINTNGAGNWLITEILGSGSSGAVYKIVPSNDQAIRACYLRSNDPELLSINTLEDFKSRVPRSEREKHTTKSLKVIIFEDKAGLERVKLEATIMEKIKHPNIINLMFYERYSGKEYIFILEYANNGDMKQMMKQSLAAGVNLELTQVLIWFLQMLEAVTYCHIQLILHNDIKPENFLLHNGGGGLYGINIKLTDFGLSKKLQAATRGPGAITCNTGIKEHGLMRHTCEGTYRYNPPEQFERKEGFKSDLWSLGVVLYEMVTLKPITPLKGKDLSTIIRSIIEYVYTPKIIIEIRKGPSPAPLEEGAEGGASRSEKVDIGLEDIILRTLDKVVTGLLQTEYRKRGIPTNVIEELMDLDRLLREKHNHLLGPTWNSRFEY